MRTLELRRPLELVAGFQHYDWGDRNFIPELFRFAPSGTPYAEAWLGAHPRLPATLRLEEQAVPLDRMLEEHGEALLGKRVQQRFGGLPYLLKVLAAERPLSIQVHPSREQARAGYAREDAAGVPLAAPHRNYRDDNHKPELIVALTPFFALCGFRSSSAIVESLGQLPELERLLPQLEASPESLRQFVTAYLELAPEPRALALAAWIERLTVQAAGAAKATLSNWVLEAHRATRSNRAGRDEDPDPGLFFFLLLSLFRLKPGQGLFLSAGVPHAYLAGAGVEVMANSDNVLRCGLTTKHTDRQELLRILSFESSPTRLLDPGVDAGSGLRRYPTPASEFQLDALDLEAGQQRGPWHADGPETLLVTRAAGRVRVARVDQPATGLVLHGGQGCLVPDAVDYQVEALETSSLVRVTVPDV